MAFLKIRSSQVSNHRRLFLILCCHWGLHPGARSGELPASHTATLLGAAAGPVAGGSRPGGGAERGPRRPGHTEGAPQPAAQH